MTSKALRFSSFVLGVCTLMIPALGAGAPPCANLSPQPGELGYQPRGERCEGMFIEDTRSNVRLKSLLAPSSTLPPPKEHILRAILPQGVPEAQYHLRVNSLDPRVHYQLDAFIPKGGVFSWPTRDVVDRKPIGSSDLAPLSWTVSDPTVYVPVSFPAAASTLLDNEQGRVLVIVESTVPITQYVARLISQASGERIELKSPLPLPTTQLKLTLPAPGLPGYYTLWLRVLLLGEAESDGDNWTLWLP